MTTITIRQIKAEQWAAYRDVRLAALKDSPEAFSTTVEQAQSWPDSHWQLRLSERHENQHFAVFAYQNTNIVGLCWALKEQNIVQVFQMWVAPQYRGIGASKALINSIVNWAKNNSAQCLNLSVTQTNVAAIGLYKASGFVETGASQPLRAGSSLQVLDMVLQL